MSQFDKLFRAVCKAYPDESGKQHQAQTQRIWRKLKEECGKDKTLLDKRSTDEIQVLETMCLQKRSKYFHFFTSSVNKKKVNVNSVSDVCELPHEDNVVQQSLTAGITGVSVRPSQPLVQKPLNCDVPKAALTPAQDEMANLISVLNEQVVALQKRKNVSLGLGISEERELKFKMTELDELRKKLKRMKYKTEKNKQYRDSKRMQMQEILFEYPDIAKKMKIHSVAGRPRVEDSQPQLLQMILEIALHGASAESRRRSEELKSCRTLDELTAALKIKGINISRSGTYLRLLPRCSRTEQGKRHIKTVPVKLCKASNSFHKSHIDGNFCTNTINNLEEIASTLGPTAVIFLSQDDKARVPIGLTAAKKQSPLLMHVEYKIQLPDHDWVIANKHKLIPSVYALCDVEADKLSKAAVTYSGPTYIAIRSGKHNSSTALSHGYDFENLLELPEFSSSVKDLTGSVKPVVIMIVDGGPDENPRYKQVINVAIHHFLKYNLDALFISTNAPGRSAFNRVERRMAPLSRLLAGLILPHDHFGSHLDNSGRTIDEEKEENNFSHAGKVLAEVWSEAVIDGRPVFATYVSHVISEFTTYQLRGEPWRSAHVRESQYLLQIVKCNNTSCCGEWRSGLKHVLKDRFLPPPIPMKQLNQGLHCPEPHEYIGPVVKTHFLPLFQRLVLGDSIKPKAVHSFKITPYDLYCPSLLGQLPNRCCTSCGLYHASKKSSLIHAKWCRKTDQIISQLTKCRPQRIAAKRQRELMIILRDSFNNETFEWEDEEYVDTEGMEMPSDIHESQINESGTPVIELNNILEPVWNNE